MSSFVWPAEGGVTSLNNETGAISITSNDSTVTIVASGQTVDLSAPGSGGLSLGAFGSSPNGAGASLTGGTLTLQPADGTHPGGVSTAAQTIAGAKTFSTAPVLSSLTASLPLQLDASKNITAAAIDLSGSEATGTLAAGRFPALTGDVTTSAGSLATTAAATQNNITSAPNLATVGTIVTGTWAGTAVSTAHGGTGQNLSSATGAVYVSSGTVSAGTLSVANGGTGNASPTNLGVPVYETSAGYMVSLAPSADYQVFTASATGIPQWGTVNLASNAAVNGQLQAASMPALTGDITTAGGALATTAAATQNNITSIPNLVTVGTIGTGTWAGTAIAASHGGTGQTSLTSHSVLVGAGTAAVTQVGPDSTSTKVLASAGSSADPAFQDLRGNSTLLKAPTMQTLTSNGTQTGWLFLVTSANATVGAVYTNNSNSFTVQGTISSGTLLYCSGTGSTTGSTLTKSSGTGDSTITFSSKIATATYTTPSGPAPLYLRVRMCGGGGGGLSPNGSGSTGGTQTAFGANLVYCNGGSAASSSTTGGSGGSTTITAPAYGTGFTGGQGSYGDSTINNDGGNGGTTFFVGNGLGGPATLAGTNAVANSGSGGGGGGAAAATYSGGGGGGAGGFLDAIIPTPSASYPYIIGSGGTGGSSGSGGNGGNGATGYIEVTEHYQ